MKRISSYITLTWFVWQSLSANFSFHSLPQLNNQLSNNAILCMHQDPYGFLWLGTYDGLNLYNGKEVTTFRFEAENPYSLRGNSIHSISKADDDHLWVVTQLGLDKFSLKERRVVESFPEYKKASLIKSDKNGNTWLIFSDNFLSYYNHELRKFTQIPFEGISRHNVRSFYFDDNDQPCLVKDNGVIQYVKLHASGSKKNPTYSVSFHEKPFHNRNISQVFYEDGMIYFVDEDRNLLVYDDAKQQKILIRNIGNIISRYGIISSLCFFQNEIYIAFLHSGLVKIDPTNHEAPDVPINTSIGMFGLLKDRNQEALWIGTDGEGAGLYYREKEKFGNILLSQLSFTARRPIRSFYTDEENTLWIGTKGDGIIRIKEYDNYNNVRIPETSTQRFLTHAGMSENPVYCFVRSRYNKNDLWVGTDGNISYYSYKDRKLYPVTEGGEDRRSLSNVHTLCEVNDSTLWVSSLGLHKVIIDKTKKPYQIKGQKKYFFQKDNRTIDDEFYSLVFDGDSTIFLGSRGGYGVISLNIFTEKYRFISMDKKGNKPIGDVICLLLDSGNVLYAGASSGFIQIKKPYENGADIKQFNRSNGIINDMIHGILKDKSGVVWFSTNKGLVKYNPANESFFNLKSAAIGVSEYSDNAYWRCPFTDRLFFGGVNGLTWIEPRNGSEPPNYQPTLLFTELTHWNEVKTLYDYNETSGKKLKIPYSGNTFEVTFAVLDYINGDSYDYSYQLENYNSHWVSLQKENRISFTNLPPGEYVLKVKYINDVLQSDNRIYTLPIVILPPWYLSLVARIIYFLLIALIGAGIFYYIKRKFRQKQDMVAQKIKEEQKEKLYESKMRFFTNITHELYTPLTLINGALEQIQNEEGSPRLKKYTGILQNNVLSLNDLIKEILEYRKIEETEGDALTLKKVSISEILKGMLTSFAALAERNKVEFEVSVPENIVWTTDSACFKKIISNLLSNAFKYTPAGGTIRFHAAVNEDKLKVEVFNTGKGIEPDKIKQLFSRYRILENTDVNSNNQMTARNGLGLFICHSITKLLQGEIAVESKVDEYVKFTVLLPQVLAESTENEKLTKDNIEKEKPVFNAPPIKSELQPYVLIVDDNAEIVEMMADMLASDFQVMKAYNAREALGILKKQLPSIIITDIMMPEMDGLSFIQMVRQDKFMKHLPIVAVSAKTDPKDQIKGYKAGADAYITKPFSSEMLLSIVKRFLISKEQVKEFYDSAESYFQYTEGQLLLQEDKAFIDKVLTIINHHIADTALGPEFIADKLKMSSRSLHRQMKRILSVTTTDFIKEYKLTYASRLLVSTNLSVKEIINNVGISNKSYFYREFLKKFNASPKVYREENQKEISE